jgi:uncharacterized protein (TIGR02270 family)
MLQARGVIQTIVDQHAEEAAFLWLLRDQAVDAPHYDRHDLARLEERVAAHLDGLRVAGEAGRVTALAMLEANPEPGELFAASVLALEAADRQHLAPLLELAEVAPEARRGLLGAIGWVPTTTLRPLVQAWLDSALAFERFLGLVACSHHRVDPGRRLGRWLVDPDPLVAARAARLAGELGRTDLRDALQTNHDAGEAVAAWRAWSLGLLGEEAALPELERLAEAGFAPALQVALRAMPASRARSWLRQLNGDPAQARLVVEGLGIIGDPQAVPWLIGRMSDPALARLAGESVSLITGIDLAYDDLDGDAPEGYDPGPTPDPADDNTAMDQDEDLPWPDPELLEAWWEQNAPRFTPGTRHLLGRPIDEAACDAAWTGGFQRQRRAAAYELAVGRVGAGSMNWRRRA